MFYSLMLPIRTMLCASLIPAEVEPLIDEQKACEVLCFSRSFLGFGSTNGFDTVVRRHGPVFSFMSVELSIDS